MKRIWLTCLTSSALWGFAGIAIAQETPQIPTQPDNLTTTANQLQGTIPVNTNPYNTNILGNGVQFNNGLSNSLSVPQCNKPVCLFTMGRVTSNGSEILGGAIVQLGNSADDIKAEAEKAKVEIERIKGDRDYKIQLMEKIATAIEVNNCTRARIFSQELATISGYKNHWDYLKDIDARLCMR